MDEFLKINWRLNDLSKLKAHDDFISEDVIANSLVYKHFQDKTLFLPRKAKGTIFQQTLYIPGQVNLKTFVKSILDDWAHEHCLKALKLFQSGKDPSCYTTSEHFYVDIFKKLKPKILEENSKYQTYVLEQWQKKDQNNTANIKQSLVSFGRAIWEAKWSRIYSYPQFYKELSTINTTLNENENIIDFKCIGNVLELGTLAKFSYPNLKSPCYLNNVKLPTLEEKYASSTLAVSQDENVTKILETHQDVDLVISASSLKCISDMSDNKRRWMIPVVVKSTSVQKEDGSTLTKNVTFLDKPFSQNDMCNMDFAYTSYKRLIKTNFCRFEAFKYDCQESSKDEYTDDSKSTVSDDASYRCDSSFNKPDKTIHHNASYRIWNIKKTYCQNNLMKSNHKPVEFNVLIRSKLDACEHNEHGALQPVILKPKLEMQLRFGANVPSKTELAREWTSLFFAPFSVLYRVRISPVKGEVVCVEKSNIQKVVAEAHTHYEYKPQLSLGILQLVFEEMTRLEPGHYLLQHLPKHEVFISVLKECKLETSKQDIFDLHSEYDKVHVNEHSKRWLPIDVNFILPSFEAINRMPGMFTPRPKVQKKKFKKKKKTQVKTDPNKIEKKAIK